MVMDGGSLLVSECKSRSSSVSPSLLTKVDGDGTFSFPEKVLFFGMLGELRSTACSGSRSGDLLSSSLSDETTELSRLAGLYAGLGMASFLARGN